MTGDKAPGKWAAGYSPILNPEDRSCTHCGETIPKGEPVLWREQNTKHRMPCMPAAGACIGDPGKSAATQAGKKSTGNPQAWAKGAAGERLIGDELNAYAAANGCIAIHDRVIPGTKANIDHILVTPTEVHVIDAKNYSGVIKIDTPALNPECESTSLTVNGVDRTSLVTGMQRQVSVVKETLERYRQTSIPVTGAIAFVNGKYAPGIMPNTIDGVTINVEGWAVILPKTVTRNDTLVEQIAAILVTEFPPHTENEATGGKTRPRRSQAQEGPSIPRSPSGRIPKWVLDETLEGKQAGPQGWRHPDQSLYPETGDIPVAGTPAPKKPRRRRKKPTSRRKSSNRRSNIIIGFLALAAVVFGIREIANYLNTTIPHLAAEIAGGTVYEGGGPTNDLDNGTRVLPPITPASISRDYAFLYLNPDGLPATFSPCVAIHYTINPANAPKGSDAIIDQAFADLSAATGLSFIRDPDTNEPLTLSDRGNYQPERYGDRWAPVLIQWSPLEGAAIPGDDKVGEGGPAGYLTQNNAERYVTGVVTLDPEGLLKIRKRDGRDAVLGVVRHELGHLVGLDHVDKATELMYPETHPGISDYQAGDLTGLAILGAGRCGQIQ